MRVISLLSIYLLAKMDPRIVFIGSDLGAGTLKQFQQEMPDRFFMEGISEQHIIGMAAGLAMEGYIPFINTIATFLTRRCLEQILIDLCMHNLPVRLLGYGGGIVYAPLGPTHLATDDLALLRTMPNMTIVAPCDANEMKRLILQTADWKYPMYIRLAQGGDKIISQEKNSFQIGKAIWMKLPGEVLLISTGVMTQRAMKAASLLSELNINAGVLHVHTIKPIDVGAINLYRKKVKLIVTIEEHLKNGGLGSAVIETLHEQVHENLPRIVRLGLPDKFIEGYGTQRMLLNKYQLNSFNIVEAVQENISALH